MKTNKEQKKRIDELENGDNCKGYYGIHCFFDEYDMDVNQALEDFVTDRFLIPENGEVETVINTSESYFNMLIDFLEYLNNYDYNY